MKNTHHDLQGPQRFGWFKRHKGWAITLGIVIILIIAGGVVAGLYLLRDKAPSTPGLQIVTPDPQPEPIKYYSPLTGNEVSTETATKQAVTAVMIENSPDARPQSGLQDSGVVFEAIAEGGITRFLVLYQQEKPKLVGPVRSLRMYYVDWAAPFNASLAHIGGSAAALREVRNGKYRDIDQFFNAAYYWRATDRYAPHNVYTSFEKLDALNKAKGYTSSKFTGFTRADSQAAAEPTATKIDVTISSSLYNSHYAYSTKTNTYKRSVGGEAHKDREDGQLSPRVVIVMKVAETTVFEDGYRQSIQTTGSGQAYIFQDGTVVRATWKKSSRNKQITFTDKDGKEVALARGQTWITAVPQIGGGVAWR